jgi:hypothetical protein
VTAPAPSPVAGGRHVASLPLWEPKFSRANLDKLANNEAMYARGYRMHAISPGDLLFPSFASCYAPGVVLAEVIARRYPAYVGVDLAGTTRPGNCIFVLGVEPGTQRRYALEVLYGNWSSPTTAGHVAEVCTRHNVQWIQVENNAYQQALIDWMRKEKTGGIWTKVEPFTTGKNKADPTYGLASLEVELKNRSWVLPEAEWHDHDATCVCGWCRWKREMGMFPQYPTWDGCMAAWFARDAANKWAPTTAAGRKLGNLNAR